jgi:hypothetical protein
VFSVTKLFQAEILCRLNLPGIELLLCCGGITDKLRLQGARPVSHLTLPGNVLSKMADEPVQNIASLHRITGTCQGVGNRLLNVRVLRLLAAPFGLFPHRSARQVRPIRQSFYSRYGFFEVGHCTFTLGDRVDDDRVWCKVL